MTILMAGFIYFPPFKTGKINKAFCLCSHDWYWVGVLSCDWYKNGGCGVLDNDFENVIAIELWKIELQVAAIKLDIKRNLS